MKWNMVFGALVVSVGLCSQSFGFELLDRMLGLNDCGCNSCGNGCKKSCHRHCHRSLCDLFACHKSCCKKSCGNGCCNAEPSCGCGGGGATTAAPADDAAPMPPAPTADPSASIQGRRVLSASSKVVRRN